MRRKTAVHLYQHFVENGRIQGVSCGDESLLA